MGHYILRAKVFSQHIRVMGSYSEHIQVMGSYRGHIRVMGSYSRHIRVMGGGPTAGTSGSQDSFPGRILTHLTWPQIPRTQAAGEGPVPS
jgi:hypothetical protein